MKKVVSLFLSVIMLLSIAAGIDFSAYADDYIEIWNIEDLDNINLAMDKKYKLMADIDMTIDTAKDGAYNNNGWGWKPIGYDNIMKNYMEFTGEFDGDGHSIIGININCQGGTSNKDIYIGLFAFNSGIIKDLHIVDANNNSSVTQYTNLTYRVCLGGLVGRNSGDISNCSFSGTINTPVYSHCGGIAGINWNGRITNCFNTGAIKSKYKNSYETCGGITSENINGSINNCYNCGTINDGKDGKYGYGISDGYVDCCYNIGDVEYPMYSGNYLYCLEGVCKETGSNIITLNETQATIQQMYPGLDFENVWIIDPDSDYPYPQLRGNRQSVSTEIPPEEPSVDLENFKIKTVSLSLESSITMNYKVLKTAISDFENPYIKFTRNGKITTVTDYTEQGDYYVFSYRDIAPQAMKDNVQAVLYATHNDVVYNSDPVDYSVSAYAYAMLEKSSSNQYARLRTLLVDLLNYGAAAQVYQNYKTDELVNANLTDEQKSWASSQELNLTNVTDKACDVVDNPAVEWKSVGLQLNNSVAVRYKFAADNVENVQLKITCGKREWIYGAESFVDNGDGTYTFVFNDLNTDKMQKDIYITAMTSDTAVSNTMRYSIESYAKQIQDSMPNSSLRKLTDAMMRYGISAANYAQVGKEYRMKEKYLKPETDIKTFAMTDVITTSSSDGGDGPIELPDIEL